MKAPEKARVRPKRLQGARFPKRPMVREEAWCAYMDPKTVQVVGGIDGSKRGGDVH